MNKINKQNSNRLIDAENRLTAIRGEGLRTWMKKVKGLRKTKIHRHRQQNGDYQKEEG